MVQNINNGCRFIQGLITCYKKNPTLNWLSWSGLLFVNVPAGFQTSQTIYRRMFPRTFFDLTSQPGGLGQFQGKTEEVLSQIIWIRALRCVLLRGTEGSGSMVMLVHTQCRRLVGQKLKGHPAGHFWEAELTLWQERMGVNTEVIDGFSWLATWNPSTPVWAGLCHELPLLSTSFSAKADMLRWVSNNLTHTQFYCSFQKPCAQSFLLSTV